MIHENIRSCKVVKKIVPNGKSNGYGATNLNLPEFTVLNSGNIPCQMEKLFPIRSKLAISLVEKN